MGSSVTVYVAFGFDLGGDDTGWALEGIDEYGGIEDLELTWLDHDWHNDDRGDLDTLIELELERTRVDHANFRVLKYQHSDFSRFALVARDSIIEYHHGSPAKHIQPQTLSETVRVDKWDRALRSALGHLGLRPTSLTAQWLLMSYWST
jgi:hypothetical protein